MPSHPPVTESQVLAFLRQFVEASATRSFASVADMIHPDALFRFNDGDYRGLDAIRGAFESTWALDVKDERYDLSHIVVMSVDADSAAATFQFHWSGTGAQGTFEILGRGTSVLVRHQDRLKVMVEHLSR
jgi:ketosteroid isomerase-like protein